MFRLARQFEGFELRARDGQIGRVTDLLFDDRGWTIRYLVVETGTWLDQREVVIAPATVRKLDEETRTLAVDLTQEQVRQSPRIDPQQPISREQEIGLVQYYNWPIYWGAAGFSDPLLFAPPPYFPDPALSRRADRTRAALDQPHHIRSADDVRGHRIEATDGEIGHVDDFLIDEASWEIGYIVVDTRNWWPGKRVLVSPDWIFEVGWDEAKVYVDLTRDAIKRSPPCDPAQPISAEYVGQLHEHYGLPRRDAEP